jgi:hypothetical protein
LTIEPGKREIIAIINTASVDNDNEVVLPGGIKKKDYNGLPVYFNHGWQNDKKPIGAMNWVKSSVHNGKQVLISKAHLGSKTPDSIETFDLLQENCIKGVSIAFKALEQSKPSDPEVKAFPGAKNIVRKWDLREWSLAPMQCNEEAIVLMVSKGYRQELIDLFTSKKQEEAVIVHEIKQEVKENKLSPEEVAKSLYQRIDCSKIKVDADKIIRKILEGI